MHKKSVNVFSVGIPSIEVVRRVYRVVLLLEMCCQNMSFMFFNSNVLEESYFLRVVVTSFQWY